MSYAIYCTPGDGPIFGNGYDIRLWFDFTVNTNNYTNLGVGYVNDTGIDGKKVMTGEYNFTVKEIEVFTIIF
jgi:hypothetical protein